MNRLTQKALLALALTTAVGTASAGLTYTPATKSFTDNYIGRIQGSDDWNNNSQDVYGDTYRYDTYSLHATVQSSGAIEVKVFTEFAGQQNNTSYDYGDLFFDTSWDLYELPNPNLPADGLPPNPHTPGTAAYDQFNSKYDNWDNGTDWEYVVHIDNLADGDVDTVNNADATLYKIDYSQVASKNDVLNEASTRQNHEWRAKATTANINSGALVDLGDSSASWSVDPTGDSTNQNHIAFNFNLQDIGIPQTAGDFQLAFHWTMSCGNDIIQGVLDFHADDMIPPTPGVPEPATLVLLSGGLLGLAGLRRRKLGTRFTA